MTQATSQAHHAPVPTPAAASQHRATAEQDSAEPGHGHLHAAPHCLQGNQSHGEPASPLPRQMCCATPALLCASFPTAVACFLTCTAGAGVEMKRAHLCRRGKPICLPPPASSPQRQGSGEPVLASSPPMCSHIGTQPPSTGDRHFWGKASRDGAGRDHRGHT